jgi:hypothetical protein
MSSADEARFRLQSSNSEPRFIKVIALDGSSEKVLGRLARRSWNHATFLRTSMDERLTDLAGHPRGLNAEVDTADLVVMVAAAGGIAQAAASIGGVCRLKRVNTAAFISGGASASDAAISQTLAHLRPWSLMVVIAQTDDYIEDMLVALRA